MSHTSRAPDLVRAPASELATEAAADLREEARALRSRALTRRQDGPEAASYVSALRRALEDERGR